MDYNENMISGKLAFSKVQLNDTVRKWGQSVENIKDDTEIN